MNVLVASDWVRKEDLDRLRKVANVSSYKELESGGKLDEQLPSVDVLLVAGWPSGIGPDRLSKMKNLKMVQCLFAGVDSLPVSMIPDGVLFCSNAGAYSQEVAEHALALTLSAARCITVFAGMPKEKHFFMESMQEVASRMLNLERRTAGILGYGGIGSAYAKMVASIGMKVITYGRTRDSKGAPSYFWGRSGLEEVLRSSDVVLISLPLTRATRGLIGGRELGLMKDNTILVNIARGDIVDRKSIADHLRTHPRFWYASDVGWRKDGKETGDPDLEFSGLENYLVTPHVAGVSSQPTGRPSSLAVDNIIRFIQQGKALNVVDKSEY